jgi:hypothetical protein
MQRILALFTVACCHWTAGGEDNCAEYGGNMEGYMSLCIGTKRARSCTCPGQ